MSIPGQGLPQFCVAWRNRGSVRIGANVTNFEAYLRASGSARRTMTARSPDLSAYCSFGRFWREP
jgi:hypothetical protein